MSWNIIQRIREGQKVPTADVSTNTYVNDVVGNKTDAAVTTATTTKSLMAYVKGCLARFVPSLTAATTAGTIVQDSTTGTPDVVTVTTNASANTFGSWAELDASASADSWIMGCFLTVVPGSLSATNSGGFCVEIGTGTAGNEAAKIRLSMHIILDPAITWAVPVFVPIPIPIKVASGIRIAARASSIADAGGIQIVVGLSRYIGLET